ncbi:tRNA pseudouridine(38-40) synthase TruA [Alteromonadaceae bacterium M269]|nr:tRNA pseudouridine(38-40) synthase TruA [Alteromonadaceae bacterium M269]
MRYALGVEYNGSQYNGWQRQREVNTVQQELEEALSQIADEPITVSCAGRTDAGVHATGQVVHFDTTKNRVDRAWTLGMNTKLPDDIAVRWVKQVPDHFHARFSATARRYRYIVLNQQMRSGILKSGLSHHYPPLDVDAMMRASRCLIGEHDFTTFRATFCQAKTPNREIKHLTIKRLGEYVVIDIQANAFLHHMVRNIVGTLFTVGEGEKPESWVEELLLLKDRVAAAATAKPHGLYLVDVSYPDEFELPRESLGPIFLQIDD